MPFKDAARYLDQCVQSLNAQTHALFHVVAIDDGSVDDGAEILRKRLRRPLTLLSHAAPMGVSASLNHGLAHIESGLVVRMDADDIAHPRRIDALVEAMDVPSRPDAVFSWYRYIDSRGRALPTQPCPSAGIAQYAGDLLCIGNFISHPTVAFRRESLRDGYVTDSSAEDYATWLAHASTWQWAFTAENLLKWRLHSQNQSLMVPRDPGSLSEHLALCWESTGMSLDPQVLSAVISPAGNSLAVLLETDRTIGALVSRLRSTSPPAGAYAAAIHSQWQLRALLAASRDGRRSLVGALHRRGDTKGLLRAALLAGRRQVHARHRPSAP